ncbi:MAG: DUF938 domain-containing protein [Deltaproteobacteria bacterium]|nr:DUF938 domain-containing protein [Deltaproteobacteria bacterium]
MKQFAEAAGRNIEPILDVLRRWLPAGGILLEIASGTGQHAARFAHEFPQLTIQPSDRDPVALKSIAAWVSEVSSANLRLPLVLDTRDADWAIEWPIDVLVGINMVHISPWESCLGLFAGASRYLASDGLLYLYGPYMLDGQHTAPSNARFDDWLRQQDPRWGVRDVGALCEVAADHGLQLAARLAMPANNMSLLFRREIAL